MILYVFIVAQLTLIKYVIKKKTKEYFTVYCACTICKESDKEEIYIGMKNKQIQSQRNALGC